jgi:hypothetical protein
MTKISIIFVIPTPRVINDAKAIKPLLEVHAKKIKGHTLKTNIEIWCNLDLLVLGMYLLDINVICVHLAKNVLRLHFFHFQVVRKLTISIGTFYFEVICAKCHLLSLMNLDIDMSANAWVQ